MKWLLVFSALLSQIGFAATEEIAKYKVDGSHAAIVFRISHLDFSYVYGIIPGLDGMVTLNETKPEKSTFEITAKTEGLYTADKKRDEHLRGPDFFNVKQFPEIKLKSKAIKKTGNVYDVTADLTLNGKTKPVNFQFTRMNTGKDPWGNARTGGEAKFKIKRSDFGMTYMNKPGEIGDEVELMVSLEGLKQ